jgi:O-antigen/teichoic acid export membrane protein
MRAIIKKILDDSFLKHNLIFFVGSMVAAFLSYLYHPVLGRMMSLEDFGETEALISLYGQLAIFLTVFSYVAINITSNSDNEHYRNAVIDKLRKISLGLAVIISLLLLVFNGYLKSALRLESSYPFFALAALLLLGVAATFKNAYLQGRRNFKAVSVNGIIGSAGKLFFAILLVALGWRVFGAIFGLILAQIASLFYLFQKTGTSLKLSKSAGSQLNKGEIRRQLYYGFLILVSIGVVTFLNSSDILWIKHYFSPKEAGAYSGVAMVGRIIFFVTGSVTGVLFPSIKPSNHSEVNNRTLLKALVLIFVLGGGVWLIFALFPEPVIKFLIGQRYLGLSHILPRLGLMLFFASVINAVFFYLLALRKYAVGFIAFFGFLLVSLLSLFFHQTIEQIVNNFLIGTILIIFLLTIYQLRNKRAIHTL